MIFLETDIWTALSNPFIVSTVTLISVYIGKRALTAAMAKKTNIEGVVLTIDKLDELSSTILILRDSSAEKEAERLKLHRALGSCQEDCTELKGAIQEFLEATNEIHNSAGDKLILRQVEWLKQKVNK